MASDVPIERKDLWDGRGNIDFDDWVRAANALGIPITTPNSGSSHRALRKPGTDIGGPLGLDSFVVNIYPGLSKQANGDIFKSIVRKAGFSEDEIWKALGKLK